MLFPQKTILNISKTNDPRLRITGTNGDVSGNENMLVNMDLE